MLQGEALVGYFTCLLGQVDSLRTSFSVIITALLVLEENVVTLVRGVDLLLLLTSLVIT